LAHKPLEFLSASRRNMAQRGTLALPKSCV
jgi:hypothetical protein